MNTLTSTDLDVISATVPVRPLLWFHFNQNNSGGYFVENENVCEDVYVQAHTAAEAIAKAETFMDNSDSCACCGDRWSFWMDDRDGTVVPMRYGEPAEASAPDYFHCHYKLHFIDGHVETHTFGAPRAAEISAA